MSVTDETVSIDSAAISEFLVESARMRSGFQTAHDDAVGLMDSMRFTSSDEFSGNQTWIFETSRLISQMKEAERAASDSRDEFVAADQEQQFLDAGVTVSTDGETLVVEVDSGSNDDDVEVVDLGDGRLGLVVNGNVIELTEEQSNDLRIETGGGDDTVTVGSDVDTGVEIDGGAGDDTITGGAGDDTIIGGSGDDRIVGGDGIDDIDGGSGDDNILGGSGNDTIEGGDGEDYIEGQDGEDTISGGDGIDIIYGGADDDTIEGGAGADYLEGQDGDDTISGGDGDDQLSGGEGDDTLDGNLGADRVFAGTGNDTIEAGAADSVYATDEATINGDDPANLEIGELEEIPDNIVIEGTPEFQARVEADLAVLAQTEEGRKILQDIADSEHGITIIDNEGKGSFLSRPGGDAVFLDEDGNPGPGGNGTVKYDGRNPSSLPVGPGDAANAPGRLRTPPIVVLFHELVHGEQAIDGEYEPGSSEERNLETNDPTGREDPVDLTPNRELDAVGIPFEPDRDQNGRPDTDVELEPHPTENSFREELGIEKRSEY